MKWVLVSNNEAAIQEFHLIEAGECKVVLKMGLEMLLSMGFINY
jgi:hypothetical protein